MTYKEMKKRYGEDKLKAWRKKRYAGHKEEILRMNKKYREKNKEKIIERRKEYDKKYNAKHIKRNSEKKRINDKKYYEKHKDQIKKKQKEYVQKNRKKANDRKARYKKTKKGKLRAIIYQNKRNRGLAFIPLNEPFEGSVAHHVDHEHVIFIPEEIHKSIYHNIWTGQNMNIINRLAFEFLEGTNL